ETAYTAAQCEKNGANDQQATAQRIEVLAWIEREPSLPARRRIAQSVSGEGMAELMQRKCDQDDQSCRGEGDDQLERTHYSRPSSSVFLASYSSGVIAPLS